MFSLFARIHKSLTGVLLAVTAILLVSCGPISMGGPGVYRGEPVPVALLVPSESVVSGDMVLARSLENAARMAIADLDGVNIDLRIYSTGGQREKAHNAAVQAVNDGAKIILGPVYAEAANAAGVAVAPTKINVLSFSNNTAIAGGNVFVLGHTFQNTADRLAAYARANGVDNVMVVHGQNPAENLGRDAIVSALIANNVRLAGVSSFEMSQQGISEAMPRLRSSISASGADAVFLTSGTSGALPFLSQSLLDAGIDPRATRFLGLQRWDIPAQALTLPGLQGGWFALPDPALQQQFENRYFDTYSQAPHPLASLAYDGIAAIGALVQSGGLGSLEKEWLTQGPGFAGVNGVFRLLPDGTVERGLAVATIYNNQVTLLDPAPRSFSGPGL